ncbi:MAG: hypothetical protein LBC73_10315 [Oscillospiraceae bacterium]|nr:hypothetical protein [Oscillospiraceae bacterium]
MKSIRDIFDEIFYYPDQITMPLAYIRRKVIEYVYKSLPKKEFVVKFESSISMIPEGKSFTGDYSTSKKELRLYYRTEDVEYKFKERMNFAEAIAFLVLRVVPYQLGERKYDELNSDDLFYFASKLLRYYASMNNGAILRGNYGLGSEEEVKTNIIKYYGEINEPSDNKEIIDNVFDELFEDDDNAYEENRCFRCETRIIKDYLSVVDLHKREAKIHIKETDGYAHPKGDLHCAKDSSRYVIWHTDEATLSNIRVKNWYGEDISPINAISIIIAHELGHLVLHRRLSKEKRAQGNCEIEAFKWARYMLEAREYRYNEGHIDSKYTKACKKWKEYITLLLDAMGYDKKSINEIYSN